MDDFLPIKKIDHIEMYVGNAKQAAHFYRTGFGFANSAYSGLETRNRQTTSYVMEQRMIRLVLTAPLSPDHPVARHVHLHGDGVGIIALEVPDAASAYHETTKRGATGAIPPTQEKDEYGVLRYSAIHAYGDTLIKFVDRSEYNGVFAPGFQPRNGFGESNSGRDHRGVGLAHVDHMVGNVELGAMNRWVQFFAATMGFSQLIHFDDQDISTEYSALMSKVMQDGTGKVKFPINEPAEGKRKSQIQEYLDYYYGPGVQHLALLHQRHPRHGDAAARERDRVSARADHLLRGFGRAASARSTSRWTSSPSLASWWTATRRATCSRSSPSRCRIAPPSSSRSSSATARAASARATSRRSSRRSSTSRSCAATCRYWILGIRY